LHEQLAQASPDLMREMLATFINAPLSAQATRCAAPSTGPVPRPARTAGTATATATSTPGSARWTWRCRSCGRGRSFPDWLMARRRRSEAALTSVVATCYLLGVSTRRMDKLVRSLGITGLSKSQVSVMAKDLDEHVADFRTRLLSEGPHTFAQPTPS